MMKDRYLFKAKRVDNGEWVTGYYVKGLDMYDKEVHLIFEPATIFYSNGETDGWNEIDPPTIFSDACAPIRYGSYQNCFDSTKAEHIGFYVDWSGKYTKYYRKDFGYWIHMVDIEVIGNIFDNPELLESEE